MQPPPPSVDLEGLLRALKAADVRFVVVGGVAAVLHGAPTTTQDLDIVPEQSEANTERLLRLLRERGAVVRDLGGRRIEPTLAALRGRGQVQLITDLGPLDLLCRLHDGRGYDELVAHTKIIDAGDLDLEVIDLETLIEIKSSAGRIKDRMVVPLLLAILKDGSPD